MMVQQLESSARTAQLLLLKSCLSLLILLASATSLFHDPFSENMLNGPGGQHSPPEPEFVEPIRNVTVPAGREAVLSCVVSHLGKYKVGWIRADDQTILTLDLKVVTHNSRVGVSFDGLSTWSLHLRQVKRSDRGCYVCQINTKVRNMQEGCIDVHVSPNIIDEETSSDMTVREGENATLTCRATGHPPPRIIWKREDGEKIVLRRGFRDVYKGYENITGESLPFIRLDRKQMGTFLCISTNDVPPAVSKRITLDVNFPPLIKVPSQLLGAPFGTDVSLECHVEACPKAFSYWMKNRGEMLIDGLGLKNSTKYIIEETRITYRVYMRLIIKNFGPKDIGMYYCVATNSMGKAEESIRLHEIKMAKITSTTVGTESNHVVTLSGFATPPMSTEPKLIGSNNYHHKNSDTLWPYNSVSPRDSLAYPDNSDSNSYGVGGMGDGSRKTGKMGDFSSKASSSATSPAPFFIVFYLSSISCALIRSWTELLLRSHQPQLQARIGQFTWT